MYLSKNIYYDKEEEGLISLVKKQILSESWKKVEYKIQTNPSKKKSVVSGFYDSIEKGIALQVSLFWEKIQRKISELTLKIEKMVEYSSQVIEIEKLIQNEIEDTIFLEIKPYTENVTEILEKINENLLICIEKIIKKHHGNLSEIPKYTFQFINDFSQNYSQLQSLLQETKQNLFLEITQITNSIEQTLNSLKLRYLDNKIDILSCLTPLFQNIFFVFENIFNIFNPIDQISIIQEVKNYSQGKPKIFVQKNKN